MKIPNIENTIKYMNIFVDTRSNRMKNVRHFINNETGITYSFSIKDGEGIFSFYTKKSTINFIRNFSNFRKKKLSVKGEKIHDKDRFYYNKFLETTDYLDSVAMNFRNTKMINPFRNYKFREEKVADPCLYLKTEFNKNKIYIHSGFVYLFNSIASHYFTLLTNALENKEIKKIVIIGHGFGGAIAKIAFLSGILAHPGKSDIIEGYFYGSPKVGNTPFESCIGGFKCSHVRFADDYLTEMPMESIGYATPKKEIVLAREEYDNCKQTDSYTYAKYLNKY